MRALLLALCLAACSGNPAPSRLPDNFARVSVLVRNDTPEQLSIYSTGLRVRLATVRGFSYSCVSVGGTGEVALYASIFAHGGLVFSPIFMLAPGGGWIWTIRTTALDLAPELVPGARCEGLKMT